MMKNSSGRSHLIFFAVLANLAGLAFALLVVTMSAQARPANRVPENQAVGVVSPSNALVAAVDISISKTGVPDPAVAGLSLTYIITATNLDAADATNVWITDTLPMKVNFTSASPGCSYLAGPHEVGCFLAVLPMTTTTPLTIGVLVDPAATGVLVNQAVISHDDTDPTPGNNSTGPVVTMVTTSADLSISKTGVPDPVTAGAQLDYTLTITNTGPSVAADIQVTDTLPLDVSFVSASPGCTYLDAQHEVGCSLASLEVGTTAPLSITVDVDPDPAGTLTNQATVSHSGADPNTGNNSTGPVVTGVATSADLSLVMSESDDPVFAGNPLTYTLTITNTGPSTAAGVIVTDTLPASGITFASADPPACNHSSGTVTCGLGSILPAAGVDVTIVVDVGTTTSGTLFNSAIVAAETADPNAGNNSTSETTQIDAQADLSITIDDDPDPVVAGQSVLTYTLTVENLGPSLAGSVSLGNVLPAGVTFVRTIPAAGCIFGGVTVTCSLGNMDASETRLFEIETTVDMDASGTLVNSATVTSLTSDPNSSNNMASEDTTVAGTSDLVLTGFDVPDPVAAGSLLTYTLALSNTGPSNAALTTITATLPAEVTFVNATAGQGSCSESAGLVTCDLGVLLVGASTDAEIVSTVDRGFGGLLSTSITASSASTDPVPLDNTIVLTTTSQVLADLGIQKLDMPEALPPGAQLTYTILVENLGPSDAAGIVITDTLPAEVNLLPPLPTDCDESGGVVTCDLPALAAGSIATTTIQVVVDAAAPLGTIVNTAGVSSASTDPVASNDLAAQTTTIADEIVDLSLTIAGVDGPLLPGDSLVYTLTVANAGPSVATGVVLTDTLPADVSLVSTGATQGSCTVSSPVVCDLGTLGVGADAAVTIEAVVNADAGDLLVNAAVVSAAQADSDTDNNSSSVETTIFIISWVLPVTEGERYDAGTGGNEIVLLEVQVTNLLVIDRVEFRRWDPTIPGWVPIATVTTPPYTTTLDSADLNYEWNEVRARAYDEDDNESLEPKVWVYRLYNRFMPMIARMQ